MLELIQFPASPFCIVQRRILEYSGAKFKITNIPNADRSLVWKVTRQRYYQVPVLRDGKNVLFEVDEHSQVIAKYLDQKLELGLFPKKWDGVQDLLWRYFENDLEGCTFKLNDIYWKKTVPPKHHLGFIRHKERKFGRGCLEAWRKQQPQLVAQLEHNLLIPDAMLKTRPFLLEPDRPVFVDFNLFGMLGNFLFSGNYKLPSSRPRLAEWYERMDKLRLNREKLHS
jgi:glutathione S-transferase